MMLKTAGGLGMAQIDWVDAKAEGVCHGLPYDTQLVSINGVEVLFWIGDLTISNETKALLARAKCEMKMQRDCVRFIYCRGKPSGYWANENYG